MKSLLILVLILFTAPAFAIGEVFKLDSAGTMYCYGAKPQAFNKNNDTDLWLKLDSSSVASLYTNPGLTNKVATLTMSNSMYSETRASFVAFSGSASSYVSIIGTFSFRKGTADIKSLNSTVIHNNLLNNCYSKSKVIGKVII